ncbi:hypothetical protein KO561_17800 [Radiobacillus kanasensis]|uniref:hypothetical protein n=1 Tax=Radiobacillus kanasensis TaxID=2844358 RepID=UPI001E47ADB9|nr:hypothetical protein [Radiobacillus kanasensis]UFT99017.1 hypothetical protein KO561_17800 [Radiobacillus kanasensis]
MIGPEAHLSGFQANPNEYGKCSSCGKLLTSKEEKMKMCSDCQNRDREKEFIPKK